jgi:hypothetical protein
LPFTHGREATLGHVDGGQVEQDVEDAEASRRFLVAARAVDMAERRLPAMRERRRLQESVAFFVGRQVVCAAVGGLRGASIRAVDGEVISDLHARRRQVEQDVEDAEASRRFLVAARAVDMAASRCLRRRSSRSTSFFVRVLSSAWARAAARASSYAALTPEEKEAEDRALAEKLAREREATAARLREPVFSLLLFRGESSIAFSLAELGYPRFFRSQAPLLREQEEELLASGRGARKRRKAGDDLEADAVDALSSFGMYAFSLLLFRGESSIAFSLAELGYPRFFRSQAPLLVPRRRSRPRRREHAHEEGR